MYEIKRLDNSIQVADKTVHQKSAEVVERYPARRAKLLEERQACFARLLDHSLIQWQKEREATVVPQHHDTGRADARRERIRLRQKQIVFGNLTNN